MKKVTVFHYDAFSNKPNMGNPAGVVLNAEDLTEEDMQQIAFKVGFSETVFSVKSNIADLRLRYFTPGSEVNLCGHATMAMIYALKTRGFLKDQSSLSIETKAGVLPIKIEVTRNKDIYITMNQAAPQFKEFNGSKEELARSLGINTEDILTDLPIMYGSTGNWTLLVPIKTLDACKKMVPQNDLFPNILKEIPNASVHPFCLETFHQDADMHGRHFSSPYSGTSEDPVTGTASGVMGAYYATYMKDDFSGTLVIEQGQEIGKDGRVYVHVSRSELGLKIEMTGNAVYVDAFEVEI